MSDSDEQCRYIADRLRYVANDDLGGLSLQKNLAAITKAEDGSWRGVMRRLADLIDCETCHLVEDDDGRTACSECGCTALCMLDASYCPECGRKVVRDGD